MLRIEKGRTTMPKYSYFCKACDEPYEVRMSMEEMETWSPRCPACGSDAGTQELFGVAGDVDPAHGGCCGGGHHGCCG